MFISKNYIYNFSDKQTLDIHIKTEELILALE
jgi:hypothetical protein